MFGAVQLPPLRHDGVQLANAQVGPYLFRNDCRSSIVGRAIANIPAVDASTSVGSCAVAIDTGWATYDYKRE